MPLGGRLRRNLAEGFSGDPGDECGIEDCRDQGGEKSLDPPDEQAEVVAGGGEDGVGTRPGGSRGPLGGALFTIAAADASVGRLIDD